MHKNKLQVLGCVVFSRVHFQNPSGQAAPYPQPLQQRDRGPIPHFLTVGLSGKFTAPDGCWSFDPHQPILPRGLCRGVRNLGAKEQASRGSNIQQDFLGDEWMGLYMDKKLCAAGVSAEAMAAQRLWLQLSVGKARELPRSSGITEGLMCLMTCSIA